MTKDDVIHAISVFAAEQKDTQDTLRTTMRDYEKKISDQQQTITGLRSIESSLQARVKEQADTIANQTEAIVELAAYRDQLKEEIAMLRARKATDERVAQRNLEMVDEIANLKDRNDALQSRCAALDHRVQIQKDEIDHLKFAMHKAGL
jgi:chromosome segregation ATPase